MGTFEAVRNADVRGVMSRTTQTAGEAAALAHELDVADQDHHQERTAEQQTALSGFFFGRDAEVDAFLRSLAMHVVARKPSALSREEIPAEDVERLLGIGVRVRVGQLLLECRPI